MRPAMGRFSRKKRSALFRSSKAFAVKLPVVQKLGTVRTAELRHPQHALRVLFLNAVRPAKQDDRGPQQAVSTDQTQPAQQRLWIAGSRIVGAPAPDRFLEGSNDLVAVEIVDSPSRGRFVLPAPLPMQAFEKHLVVLVPRHGLAGVGHPAPGFSTVAVGLVLPFWEGNHQDLLSAAHGYAIDGRGSRGFDVSQLCGDLLKCTVTDKLTYYPAIRLHAKQDGAAAVVQHGACGPHPGAQLAGTELEFQRLRLAVSGQRLDLVKCHAWYRMCLWSDQPGKVFLMLIEELSARNIMPAEPPKF